MTSATVFPDTTILIQYKALNLIDWKGLLGVDTIKLVLASPVIQEINDIRNQDISNNLAQRASETLKDIQVYQSNAEHRGQINALLYTDVPEIDFIAEGLDYGSVSDLLVASVIDYQRTYALEYTILLTEDRITKIKALAAGIEVINLPKSYRLDLAPASSTPDSPPTVTALPQKASPFPISTELSKPSPLFKQKEPEPEPTAPEPEPIIPPVSEAPIQVPSSEDTPSEEIHSIAPKSQELPAPDEEHEQEAEKPKERLTLSDIGLNGIQIREQARLEAQKDSQKRPASPFKDIIQAPGRTDTSRSLQQPKPVNSKPASVPVSKQTLYPSQASNPSTDQENVRSSVPDKPESLTSSFSFVSQSSSLQPASSQEKPPSPEPVEKPDIRLAVSNDDESRTTVIIHHPIYPSLDEVNKHLNSVRSNFPKLNLPYEPGGDGIGSDLVANELPYGAVPPDTILQRKAQRIKKYNNALDVYYTGIEKYLSDNAEFENFKRRSAKLELSLFNDLPEGLKSLYISVHFPGNVRVYYEDNLPERPSTPPPPEEPDLDMLFDPIRLPYVPVPNELSSASDLKMRGRNPAPMEVRWNKGWDVIYSIREIEKNSIIPFNPLYIAFNSFDHATSFRINYRITVASASYEQLGDLEIVVRKEI